MTAESSNVPTTKECLKRFLRNCEALTILVVTRKGTVIEEAGDTTYLDKQAMAALVAGMFSATKEIARMVGEDEFSVMLQQGKKRHIHMSLATNDIIILVIFSNPKQVGNVRAEAKIMQKAIVQSIMNGEESAKLDEDVSMTRFKEFAMDIIDEKFTD